MSDVNAPLGHCNIRLSNFSRCKFSATFSLFLGNDESWQCLTWAEGTENSVIDVYVIVLIWMSKWILHLEWRLKSGLVFMKNPESHPVDSGCSGGFVPLV